MAEFASLNEWMKAEVEKPREPRVFVAYGTEVTPEQMIAFLEDQLEGAKIIGKDVKAVAMQRRAAAEKAWDVLERYLATHDEAVKDIDPLGPCECDICNAARAVIAEGTP